MTPKRGRTSTAKGKGKSPADKTVPTTTKGKRSAEDSRGEARKKATFDTRMFSSPELATRFSRHFSNRRVIPGRNIDFYELWVFAFERQFADMGWLPIVSVKEMVYPMLVRCFYSNMIFEGDGPITTNVHGVQIVFDVEKLCHILDIPNEGLCLEIFRKWPRIPGFNLGEASMRLCGYDRPTVSFRPTANSLSVPNRILQHMLSYIVISKGGHRDDVSFFEAFLVDCILTKRKVNLGFIIFKQMKDCSLSLDSILPYGMFITKILKFFNVNLRFETDGKKLKSFDTYNKASLRRMHFMENRDGTWRRKYQSPPVGEEAPTEDVQAEDETDSQSEGEEEEDEAGTKAGNNAEIPRASFNGFEKRFDDLDASIISMGTRLEDMSLITNDRFTRLESRIDRFEENVNGKFGELMLYLQTHFRPPNPSED